MAVTTHARRCGPGTECRDVNAIVGPAGLFGALMLGDAAPVDEHAARRIAVANFLRQAGKIAAAAASGYHGARRNRGSILWGTWWFGAGYLMPVLTPVIAVAQGFGQAKPCPPCSI